jgi:hypothetical protein
VAATDKKDALRKRAMAAAATLLGITPLAQAAKSTGPAPTDQTDAEPAPSAESWTVDNSFMQYNESGRMTISEPQIGVRRDFGDERALTILATVDTVSGASPLGTLPLTPHTAPHTVTSASGVATNPGVGVIPTSNISDTRLALNGSYERPVGSASSEVMSGDVSKEHDFLALGGAYTWNRNFNQKDTTLSIGLSPEYDIVTPNGGLPYSYATYGAPGEFQGTSKTKYLTGGLIGLTQVINRRTVMQWNYSPTYENGYLNDPYKLLSLVDADGNPLSAIHENRPGSRMEHSFYWLTRYNIWQHDVFSLGLRYYTDNWGINSQTLDFTFRRQTSDRFYWEPHVRYYQQTAANFFQVGLLNGQPLPAYASADYRLSAITGVTFGVRLGWTLRSGSELILRAEYYTQNGNNNPSNAVGLQRAYNLFPELDATIFQIEYKFDPRVWTKKQRS